MPCLESVDICAVNFASDLQYCEVTAKNQMQLGNQQQSEGGHFINIPPQCSEGPGVLVDSTGVLNWKAMQHHY